METKTAGGVAVPTLGFGTYKLTGEAGENAIRDALEMGYRHIDTAEFYDNQAAVGRAITESAVDREDVFLTTKIWKTNLEPARVHQRTRDALADLDTDYVDLLLIHWPSETVPIEETVEAMNELQGEGLVRSIGVGNFSVDQLRAAIAASETPVVTNQVEYNLRAPHPDLLRFALDNDVLLTAYGPLARGGVLEEPALVEIAEAHGKTPAQTALRWLIQQPPVVAIPKAGDRDHRYENLQVFDFELSDDEMRRLFEVAGEYDDDLLATMGY
ncbi:MAG: aldo/keto reductase [Halanaeroarchaeum sp.]